MAIQTIDYLKSKFQTGMVPTQQDFVDLFDTYVASVNGEKPSSGNVTTDFKIITPLGPDRPPSDYPVGASEFYNDYNPADYAQYIADNPSMAQLEQGQICVRTFRSNGFSYQQVDNVKDGVFNSAYIRLNISPSAWGVLSPVVTGSVSPIDVIDNLFSDDEYAALSARQGKILYEMIGEIEDLATGPQGPPGIQGPPGENGNTIIVENELDSTSTTNALSAYMGKVVYDMNNFIMDELEAHVQQFASPGALGHVRVDGTTITINPTTAVISAVGNQDITNDTILPTTLPSEFKKGLTLSIPHLSASNENYLEWKNWVISASGANIDYSVPFYLYVETMKSHEVDVIQTIRVVVPSIDPSGLNEVMRINRVSFYENGPFSPPGIQMTTLRGSGSPEGLVRAFIGNSYYDYTNNLMYIKTEEGPTDPKANGWVLANVEVVDNILTQDASKALSANMGYVLDNRMDDLYDEQERLASFMSEYDRELNAHKLLKASTTTLGHVKVDGTTVTVNAEGTLRASVVDIDTSTSTTSALSANMGKKLRDDITTHELKKASETVLGHVKIDGTTVKMNNDDQLYADLSDLPIPIQMNNEYIMSDSPTTYPIGHTISMIGPDDIGFADLVTEYSLEYDVELTSLTTRFIVQTVKNDKSMTHQTAQAVSSNRGSVLGTMYRFSQSSIYGFSSWYAQTQVLTGRGAPGDQGRGEGMSGNLYVNSVTGKVHAKAGYDKTVGYTNWRVVGPTVVNNTFEPAVDDDEHVYSAYAIEQMFYSVNNELTTLGGESATHMAQIQNLNTDLSDHMLTRTTNDSMGHVQADGTSITAYQGIISAKTNLNRIWDSRPIAGNATTWTVDFSDEEELTDLNNYYFEVYDDGVLVFGNPITHVVNNANKTVTFTPQTPMSRPFTITCIGRGMEFD